MSKSGEPSKSRPGAADLTRRQVLTYLGAAGALSGGVPLTAAARGKTTEHGLFFNFSHEPDAATARYFLLARGRRYALEPIQNHAATLAEARRSNAFLRRIPDDAITHAVTGVGLPDNSVHLCYVLKNPDTSTGTWAMSSMFFRLPPASVLEAHARAADRLGTPSLPVSAKRLLYRLEATATAQDLLEEHALLDSSDHATALIGAHSDLLSAEPKSCAYVHETYIRSSRGTLALAQVLKSKGAATDQPGGWATLTALQDEHGNTIKNTTGHNKGLNQYYPVWDADVSRLAGNTIRATVQPVKDDESLGADVTPSNVPPALNGKLWVRRDGITTVDQSPRANGATDDPVTLTLTTKNVEGGYSCTGDARVVDGKIQATFTFTNYMVRWLGIWLLFLDQKGDPVTGVQIRTPTDYDPGQNSPLLASFQAQFGLFAAPAGTIAAFPVFPTVATITIEDLPETVTSIQILACGPNIKNNNPADADDRSTWGDPAQGWIPTVIVNYGLLMMLLAVGSAQINPLIRICTPLICSLVVDLFNVMAEQFRTDLDAEAKWTQIGITTLKALAGSSLPVVLTLFAKITPLILAGAAADTVPIVGAVFAAIGAVAGVATMAETSIDIVLSPRAYIHEAVLTHDLKVAIIHATNSDRFPDEAHYYKVTALFEAGTPHVQTLLMPSQRPVTTLPAVVFPGVPLGGQVNVSVGFYSSSDELLGKGTTGLVENTVKDLPDITIEQFPVSIKSNTVYVHTQKTILDEKSGHHIWLQTDRGPTVKQRDITCESVPGTLCGFRGITVRQGTASAPEYVGYAWQGYSPQVLQCSSQGQGQLDQLANIGAQVPQAGYVTAGCGFPSGAQLSYSLLTHASSNFYLDSTDPANQRIRRVKLDPTPAFDPPSGETWGLLNFSSDALLLHPSGRFVSVNTANHKIEVLRIPAQPKPDTEARPKLLASVHSGLGSRPGLIHTPQAAAISPDGVILILEAGDNHRLQAFDLGGNPVQFFKKQQVPYFLNLTATAGGDTVYLDLAVEFTGYLYVLSFNQATNEYRLDIYHPQQDGTGPISTTRDVNAAKLTVNFWRSVYTLNYEVLTLSQRTPPLAEPSVSLWLPST